MSRNGYFDNAATTLIKTPGMYEYISSYMLNNGFNSGRGDYSAVQSTGRMVRDTRNLLLKLVQADNQKDVVFCPSATIALNTILRGITIAEDDNVYVSHFEHNAVMRVLYAMQKQIGFRIIFLEIDSTLCYDENMVRAQFADNKPKVVIMSQVSNVCGLIQPVDGIAKIAKEYEAITVIDAAQACGVVDIAFQNIDYYVFAGHKTLYGPFGVGGFICNKNSTLKPYIYGGTGIDSANRDMPNSIPERFEAGSLNTMAIVGLNYSLKWLNDTGVKNIAKKENENYRTLKALLSQYDFISFAGISDNCSAIISCKFKGYAPDEIGNVLDRLGISVRTGLHCAPETHRFLNTFPEGTVRFSVSYFTSDDDFSILKSALDEVEEQI